MSEVQTSGLVCHSLAPDRRLPGRPLTCDADASVLAFPPHLIGEQHHTVINLGQVVRLAIMVTPEGGGQFKDEAWEAVSTIRAILRQQEEPMAVTMQTIFLRNREDVPTARKFFEACYGNEMPLTLFVLQPPCDGRLLAIEAWAIGTERAKVEYHSDHLVTVSHDGLRWIHASADSLLQEAGAAYEQSAETFGGVLKALHMAGASFADVVRTWLYQGSITEPEGDTERYRELNRARTDFFAGVRFDARSLATTQNGRAIYPASTGIGTQGHGLVATCLALQTTRPDVKLLPLENPLQTSSFDYPPCYSVKSPKFSRAMAVQLGDHMTTWISGTASIVNSETVHIGDVERQTEQTITNIERLIAAENFARLGWIHAGATLDDIAKIRVYVKRPEDYAACRAVCERRLGRIPAVYAQADVCRPDLLVEIEGVAFSRLTNPQHEC